MGIGTQGLIGIAGDDGRLPYEVVSDFERFIIEALDGATGNPDRERGRVVWMMAEGRVDYSKLPQSFIEKVVACTSINERRVLMRELGDECESADWRAEQCRGEAHRRGAAAEGYGSLLALAAEFEARAEALDPIDQLLANYFYAVDPAYREERNSILGELCHGEELRAVLGDLAQTALALKGRLDAYEAVGEEQLFDDVDEIDWSETQEDVPQSLEAAKSVLRRIRAAS